MAFISVEFLQTSSGPVAAENSEGMEDDLPGSRCGVKQPASSLQKFTRTSKTVSFS